MKIKIASNKVNVFVSCCFAIEKSVEKSTGKRRLICKFFWREKKLNVYQFLNGQLDKISVFSEKQKMTSIKIKIRFLSMYKMSFKINFFYVCPVFVFMFPFLFIFKAYLFFLIAFYATHFFTYLSDGEINNSYNLDI